MVTKTRRQQSGFILVTLIFLLLVGSLLLAAMAYLYGTSNTQQSVQNSGAQAFIAAESDDQYGVYYLEKQAVLPTTTFTVALTPTLINDNPACQVNPPASASASITVAVQSKAKKIYSVQAVVHCASGAQWTVTRLLQGKANGGVAGGNQGKGGGGRKAKGGKASYTVVGWTEQ